MALKAKLALKSEILLITQRDTDRDMTESRTASREPQRVVHFLPDRNEVLYYKYSSNNYIICIVKTNVNFITNLFS